LNQKLIKKRPFVHLCYLIVVEVMNRFNDRDIVEAVKSGKNDWVLNNLYREILPRIKKLITSNSGTEDDAKDIFQDAVLVFYNQVKQNKFDESKEIAGFIYSVARNLWINKVKRDNRMINIKDLEAAQEPCMNVLDDLITEEKAKVIEEVLDQIGENCKKLLKYSIYDKLSQKEIAQKMGYTNEAIVKTYNYRCKQKLISLVKGNSYIISLFKE
jgi:RNA polymerase sigma factor (sigma-70 family)